MSEYERGFKDGVKSKVAEELKPIIAKMLEGITNTIQGLPIHITEMLKIKATEPASELYAVCNELAELFGSPCDFSPIDDFMFENGDCEDCCGKLSDAQCWCRYFALKLKGAQ